MIRVLLIAGKGHRRIAHSLQQHLGNVGFDMVVLTAKSRPDVFSKAVTEAKLCVWLVSPQTVQSAPYAKIHKLLQRQHIQILPFIVNPGVQHPFKAQSVQLDNDYTLAFEQVAQHLQSLSQQQTRSHRKHFAVSLLVIILVLLASKTAYSAFELQDTVEQLPTLVAIELVEILDSQEKIVIAPDVTVTAITTTPSDDGFTFIDVPQIQLTQASEATQEVLIELTEEVFVEATEEVISDGLLESSSVLIADFSVDKSKGNAPLTINITNQSIGDVTEYRWEFNNDGLVDSSDEQPGAYTYNDPGIYTITLSVRDALGNIVHSQNTIEVYDPSSSSKSTLSTGSYFASFLTSPSSGQVPLDVRFVNRSEGASLTYEWDFNGDGGIDFVGASPPIHTYTKSGTYTARLHVTSKNGQRDTSQATITAYSTSPDDPTGPIYEHDSQANFALSTNLGIAPFRVGINNLSIGTNNSYEWDFNQDNIPDSASANPPEQRYGIPGIYTIRLTVYGFDRYGIPKISQAQQQLTVTGNATHTPTPEIIIDDSDIEADFVPEIFEGIAPLTIQFYNYSVGEISSYQWDFENNGVVDSTEFEPSFTFNQAGEYEIVLVVSDGTSTDETSFIIAVHGPETTATTIPLTSTPTMVVTDSDVSATPQSETATFTLTPTLTVTPAQTEPTDEASSSSTPTWTTEASVTIEPTSTGMPTVTSTFTATFTSTPTHTATPVPSATLTLLPTSTPLPTHTATLLPTDTPLPPPSDTPIPPTEEDE